MEQEALLDAIEMSESLKENIFTQNSELHQLKSMVAQMQSELEEMKLLTQEVVSQEVKLLFETTSQLIQLSETSEKLLQELLAEFPKNSLLFRFKNRQKKAKKIALSLQKEIDHVEDQVLCGLSDCNIDLINPEKGSSFLQKEHRIIAEKKGGINNKIYDVKKVGFKKGDQVLKKAEVCICRGSNL